MVLQGQSWHRLPRHSLARHLGKVGVCVKVMKAETEKPSSGDMEFSARGPCDGKCCACRHSVW